MNTIPQIHIPVNFSSIKSIEPMVLNAQLHHPFIIANARVDEVRNIVVCLELQDRIRGGRITGWGEIPTLPPVTAENQDTAAAGTNLAAMRLLHQRISLQEMNSLLRKDSVTRRFAAVRGGVEMAYVDAVARAHEQSLHRFLGATNDTLETDITIPICRPETAASIARQYRQQKFSTIKVKVDANADAGIERLLSIKRAHPQAQLLVDANEAFTAEQAVLFLQRAQENNISLIAFEQPVPRDDVDGLKLVQQMAGDVTVIADESVRNYADAEDMIHYDRVRAINIKVAKLGVWDSIRIAALCREHGVQLMIGGMLETRLGMGFSAALALGLGGFTFIDLDTPHLLTSDPITGGASLRGPIYDLSQITAGHGASYNPRTEILEL